MDEGGRRLMRRIALDAGEVRAPRSADVHERDDESEQCCIVA